MIVGAVLSTTSGNQFIPVYWPSPSAPTPIQLSLLSGYSYAGAAGINSAGGYYWLCD